MRLTRRDGDQDLTRFDATLPPGATGALCPKGAQYGYARAWSPLLDGPAQGPVYLRSSDNKLPDLIAALKGPPQAAVEVELSARIDKARRGSVSRARVAEREASRR